MKQMLRISLHRTAYHRHPWTMAENSTQWSQWPCLIPELQSKQSKVKASVHDWWLTIVSHAFSCSICDLTRHVVHNFLPYTGRKQRGRNSKLDKVAMQLHWKVLISHGSSRMPSKTDVMFGPCNHTHPQIYQDLQEISPDQTTKILTFVVWKQSGNAISAIKTPPGAVSSFGNTFLGFGKHCHPDPPKLRTKNGAKQQVEGWMMLHI